jgi:V/A-type H+-transporting ATPase subunit B
LESALDTGWHILAECFSSDETGLRSELIKEFWPTNGK